MASTKFAYPPFPATASPRLEPFLACKIIYQKHTPTPVIMDMLHSVIEKANKIDDHTIKKLWKFYIEGINGPVGFVLDDVRNELYWDPQWFAIEDREVRRITLITSILKPNGQKYKPSEACRIAFFRLLDSNASKFPGSLEWSDQPRDMTPLHLVPGEKSIDITGIDIPLAARGLLGVLTVGVHLNVYQVKEEYGKETIDRIWVAHRAKGPGYSYPGMLDQIVAGGVDSSDEFDGSLAPCLTLAREAMEEAGFRIDIKSQRVFFDDRETDPVYVGSVERVSDIAYFDCKDSCAGDLNKNHLEPGLRIIYDLKIVIPNFCPQGKEPGIESFEAMDVPQVRRSLKANSWKPNCGLVMLDFMVRHGLVTKENDSRFDDIKNGLRRPLPFLFAEEYNEIIKGW
ncbi:thiamine pyrophosphokinase- protein [Fusarium austroafricanum]|uniref:Thiamine pyrophosphokinase- protein n=1 Tax=Fusarium austroafricanum TaxID=2364996 RepID=A0A8H4KQH0_9HYPO|nr:thiamine pyrophosphokinase- protein [Fusarium austroafricanum]